MILTLNSNFSFDQNLLIDFRKWHAIYVLREMPNFLIKFMCTKGYKQLENNLSFQLKC